MKIVNKIEAELERLVHEELEDYYNVDDELEKRIRSRVYNGFAQWIVEEYKTRE